VPDPLFLDKLALLFAAVVPAERARQLGDDFTEQPLGSGPFVLREWRHGERLVLTRNPRYRRPDRPYLDGVVEQVGVNGELAWLMFLSGELDVSGIPPADFPAIKRDPHPPGQLVHATTLWTQYVGLNCQMPPLDDRRVRQALNYAVNKQDVIALLNDRGVVAKSVVPPGMPGYRSDTAGYPYDPARARALLAEAGQGAGFTTELWTQGSDTDLKIAQKIQRDLSQVGVTMDIKQVAWSSFLEAIRQSKTVPLFDLGWSADFPDPSNFLDVLFHSSRWDANNHSFYANPEFDRLIDRARTVADAEARLALYRAAERILVDDAPVILLYHPISYVMMQPRVHGYTIHPLLPARFTDVWLDPER
jgi:ABC-type transport system substrate-binding protein